MLHPAGVNNLYTITNIKNLLLEQLPLRIPNLHSIPQQKSTNFFRTLKFHLPDLISRISHCIILFILFSFLDLTSILLPIEFTFHLIFKLWFAQMWNEEFPYQRFQVCRYVLWIWYLSIELSSTIDGMLILSIDMSQLIIITQPKPKKIQNNPKMQEPQ